MIRKRYDIRVFRCPECGKLNYAAKRATKKTPLGHVKDMWCPYCKKIQKLIQIE